MRAFWQFITGNPIINCAFIAWLLAQALKVVFELIFHHRLDFSRFFGAGGMPSSHTSCVVALTVATGRLCGLDSAPFAIALVLSCIVMYDATGVRRAAGEQAKILNTMMKNWYGKKPQNFSRELKEWLGHTPVEVLGGAILGFLVGYCL